MFTIRALEKEDAKQTWAWRNLPEIKYFFSGHPFPVSYIKEYKWIESILLQNVPHSYFGIVNDTNELGGIAALRNIDQLNRKAEFSIFTIFKGAGEEITKKVIQFGFNDLGLNKIYLKVQEDNLKAINLYKKVGFSQEGLLRESIFKDNHFLDEIIMGILASEYLNSK